MPEAKPMKIEQVAIGKLRPNPRNSRRHGDGQVQAIAASIRRFGFNAPIIVDASGMVIAGHGRLEAARLVGLKRVPVVRLGHLSPEEARAYLIADNRLAEMATWDSELLSAELAELSKLEDAPGLDAIGYSEAELTKLIGKAGNPDPAKEKSRGTGRGGLGNPVVSYTLVFDNEQQQARFYEFLRWLRAGEVGDTIAQRLDAYLAKLGLADGKA